MKQSRRLVDFLAKEHEPEAWGPIYCKEAIQVSRQQSGGSECAARMTERLSNKMTERDNNGNVMRSESEKG